MKILGRLIPPWVWLGAAAAVVAGLMSAGWVINGWRHRAAQADAAEAALAQYRKEVTERDSKHSADLKDAQQRAERLALDLNAMRASYADLLLKIPKLPLVEYRDAPPNPEGRCSVPVRTAAFRMCHNAAWTGSPAAIAACRTIGGDAAPAEGLPAAGLVRSREP